VSDFLPGQLFSFFFFSDSLGVGVGVGVDGFWVFSGYFLVDDIG
jgi:hypothetical protein